MSSAPGSPWERLEPARAVTGLLILLAGAVAATAYRSLDWRMNGDEAVMLYVAFLQSDAGLVLYRDIFDMNAPGAHAIYRLVWALTDGGDRALRLLDLGAVVALMASTAAAMWSFGRRSAWAAAVLAALLYLGSGDPLSLQRECFLLLPTSMLLFVLLRRSPSVAAGEPDLTMTLLAGLCVGVASAIRPQAALLLLVVVADEVGRARTPGRLLRTAAAAGAGLAVVWTVVAIWLWRVGALASFGEMASQYRPLYNSLTGRPYGVVEGWARVEYLVRGYVRGLTGHRALWLLAAAAGLAWFRIAAGAERARAAGPLVVLAAVTLVFPGVAGKFWEYHYLPLGYALMLLAALAAADVASRARWRSAAFAILLIAVAGLSLRAWTDESARRVELARVDNLASYLGGHLRAGDTVQSLDWTGTALHAMLLARARTATPFLEDVHFYHHADDPYVQGLRARLMGHLSGARPRLIVGVDQQGWVPTAGSKHPFPALGALLDRDYAVAANGPGWTIYERRVRP